MELKYQHVDLNPVYADSIDTDLFTVHLMFEVPHSSNAINNTVSSPESSKECLKPYFKPGLAAFEAGLDEVEYF